MPTFANSKRARSLEAELKNGRAAMIGIASFEAAAWVQGSVPAIPSTWH